MKRWLILATLILAVAGCANIKGSTAPIAGDTRSGGGGSGAQNERGGYMY